MRKQTKAICVTLALLVSTAPLLAYPPDNAAVSYYLACLSYRANPEMQKTLKDFLDGKIEVNDNIKQYIRRNRGAIKFTITAADVQNCDWGLDYSEGMSMVVPHLSHLRNLARLITAEAKVAAAEGNYELALDRSLSIMKTAGHIGDDLLISYLVAVAHDKFAKKCIQGILSEMPEDMELLTGLKNDLAYVTGRGPSARAAVDADTRMVLADMRVEKVEENQVLFAADTGSPELDKLIQKRLIAADAEFFEKNRIYFKNYMETFASVQDSSMPYTKAYQELKQLDKKAKKDAIKDSDATLTTMVGSALHHVFNIEVESKTFLNAIKAALEIYIIKAKTGKLPDKFPSGLPKDLFSGKDFQYEKTKTGFILRCRGKNLDKDEIHHYEFKVSK
ncbi:MAG: hypothetical protein ACYS3N_22880 [Planctomycetota bacterium]|jgi:hypothetical protein